MLRLPRIPIFARAHAYARGGQSAGKAKAAVIDDKGRYSYAQLLADTAKLGSRLRGASDAHALKGERIISLLPNGYPWAVAQWATWAVGGVHVPLLHSNPVKELEYPASNAAPKILLAHQSLEQKANELAAVCGQPRVVTVEDLASHEPEELPELEDASADEGQAAFMLYTSGTTGRPKGVLHTHRSLGAQADSMSKAWKWTEDDHILHTLPLHHIHGIVNVLFTSLWNGATCEMMSKFDAGSVWNRWMESSRNLTLYMAVPTIYNRLISEYDKMDESKQERARAACSQFRLQVSGSAPLPSPVKARWHEISGQTLLERYGMSETGMILSCGLDDATRIDGHVGSPMPGVSVRLWDASSQTDVTSRFEQSGEVQVKGDLLFTEYFRLPDKTKAEFTDDGWFKTGDEAHIVKTASGSSSYQILGRTSTDIIKSGGEKLSALEIERAIASLDYIADAAVVGVPDDDWGEVVGAVIVLKSGKGYDAASYDVQRLRDDLRDSLAPYKLPRRIKIYENQVPRNAMGKVEKKKLVKTAFPAGEGQ